MPIRRPTLKKTQAKKTPVVAKKIVARKIVEEPAKSYRTLITEALVSLHDRMGSSRQTLKKFIKEKYPSVGAAANFDMYFNNAIKKGVQSEIFLQPKGPSGPLKLAKVSKTDDKKPSKVVAAKKAVKVTKKKPVVAKKVALKKARNVVAEHPSTYREMVLEGATKINTGKGASRIALKKFIKEKYSSAGARPNFDSLVNNAIKKCVDSGELKQPKGPSGVVKIVKIEKSSSVSKTKPKKRANGVTKKK
ncbi:hypothetical protein KAFR_0G01980 [Kazachstania africana CBS 2517]|uniref:Histone H1 n=1 Tax=Kazachstania africana (strain ATCC 22294 / BCRC 22015 / CBS 2517 / CECT 1963 / NBRC 1671 / NRRL Y-8276) TaxID=1071382 RepID=H2AXY2_KAZAF|nr:hypothetical protein KAFR_0G01980 [Kazachstania africana CBS 2517]CCF59232.1 hypothetical protein KAFR_0G01980 [Kazachstania africana CBS 2517]